MGQSSNLLRREKVAKAFLWMTSLAVIIDIIAMLLVSYQFKINDRVEPIQIAILTVLLQVFGLYAACTRYRTRILFFVVLSVCYAIVLIMREGLDDLQFIAHYDNVENDHIVIRLIRISLAFLVALAGALGYIVRDSSIIADNTNLNQLNLKGIEKVQQIQNQIIYEDGRKEPKLYRPPLCLDCREKNPKAGELKFNVSSHSEKCELCGKDIREQQSFDYLDEWFITPTGSVNSNNMG